MNTDEHGFFTEVNEANEGEHKDRIMVDRIFGTRSLESLRSLRKL
jgi:hypothetical protein